MAKKEITDRMAKQIQKINNLKDEKADITKDYNERIKNLEIELSDMANRYLNGDFDLFDKEDD